MKKVKLVKHPRNYFWFSKDKMYHGGSLKTTFTFAFCKLRLMFL